MDVVQLPQEPSQGDSLLFTIKSPEDPGTNLIESFTAFESRSLGL